MNLEQFDNRHLWHPYSAARDQHAAIPIVAASGCRIEMADGRQLIDGMASWWSVIHGYNHPALNRVAVRQLQQLPHVMFGGITHPPAVELGQRLLQLVPDSLQQLFYCDSGSVAIEIAIKMALQYWQGMQQPQRQLLLTIKGGYHGDTFGAMSVCDPENGMHHNFRSQLAQQLFAPRPQCRFGEPCRPTDIAAFKNLLEKEEQRIAAVILEPIVQGAGGMWFYSADWLRQAGQLCRQHQIPLIADEIATGFGRTGRMFACEHAGITPDLLCVGKALSGGYISLAAVLTNETIAAGIAASEPGVLMHGPTFMANPLACAIASESIRLLTESSWQQNIAKLEKLLWQGLSPASQLPGVLDVRCLGAAGVIEFRDSVDCHAIQQLLIERGVWLRPFGRLLYTLPPYVMTEADTRQLTAAMCEAAAQVPADG